MQISRIIKLLIVLIIFLAPLGCQRSDSQLKPLKIAVGLSLPPYVIASEDRGMEFDIVNECLEKAGYDMTPVFIDFAEVPVRLAEKLVDGAMTIKRNTGVRAYYSYEYISYHNYAITLKSNGIVIKSIKDFYGKSISAFQDARIYLGPDFKRMTEKNRRYNEVAQQYKQNIELYQEDVEVVIADINIFKWYNKDPRVTDIIKDDGKVTYHNIFEPTYYKMAFLDEDVRDGFNKALLELMSSGRYQEIINSYHIDD